MILEKFLYPQHPVRFIITVPSECGESVFLTNINLKIINDYNKIYIYSRSLHRDLYQKRINRFSNYIPIHTIRNILKREDIDKRIEEVLNNKDFEKSGTEIQTYEVIEELTYPQENQDGGKIILDDLNGKKMNDLRVQAI